MYHEGQARPPDEVCTFLYDYILNNVPPEVKELHIFSDGCPGQNRNNAVVTFLLSLQAVKKRFRKIYHYFPVRGHSFLPCDRDFGTLKRFIKKYDRVYVPEEHEVIVVKSRTHRYY
ncbi:hypothetical protein RN001_015592 [Aquatica leii]|uniref:Uncharacterized protein n=1 Tax=Aquatica leii TaxID=1421715 RepID=A0AAN7SJZ0_9COLE|nr:hypothetical protein RN001_015592 [Aquatica leii]